VRSAGRLPPAKTAACPILPAISDDLSSNVYPRGCGELGLRTLCRGVFEIAALSAGLSRRRGRGSRQGDLANCLMALSPCPRDTMALL